MDEITVFADVSCPFAYVGFTRILALRDQIGPGAAPLRARSWPLEVVNGEPLTGPALAPKVEALRGEVAPDLFGGFHAERFPSTTLPALAAEHAAYRIGLDEGMAFSLALRRRLFEDGADVGDPTVVGALLDQLGLPQPSDEDRASVAQDHEAGVALGVQGSPHFFTRDGSFFCPTLDIRHDEHGYEIAFDRAGFEQFISAAFG